VTPEQTDEIIELLRKVRDVVDACRKLLQACWRILGGRHG
jgi:hypothetical protein